MTEYTPNYEYKRLVSKYINGCANSLDVIQFLRTHNECINMKFENMLPTLCLAIHQYDVVLTTWLLKNGADAHLGSSYCGTSPIMYARSPQIFELLLTYGANVHDIDDDGNTILHHYAQRLNGSNLTMVERCRELGVRPIPNKYGKMPFDYFTTDALKYLSPPTIEWLKGGEVGRVTKRAIRK